MKNFLVAKTVQNTMGQWGVWCEISYSVSLWKQFRCLSVWNSLEVSLAGGQGVDFQAMKALLPCIRETFQRNTKHISRDPAAQAMSNLTRAPLPGHLCLWRGPLVQDDIPTCRLARLGAVLTPRGGGKTTPIKVRKYMKYTNSTQPGRQVEELMHISILIPHLSLTWKC